MIPSLSKSPSHTPFSEYTISTFFYIFGLTDYMPSQKLIFRPDTHSPLTCNKIWSSPYLNWFFQAFSVRCFSINRPCPLLIFSNNNNDHIPTLQSGLSCLQNLRGLCLVPSITSALQQVHPFWRTFSTDALEFERFLLQQSILGAVILSDIAKLI